MTLSFVLELGRCLLALVDGGTSLRLGLAALNEVLGVEEPAKLLIEPGERRPLADAMPGGTEILPRDAILGMAPSNLLARALGCLLSDPP